MQSLPICEDCGMMFESHNQLTNHKKKFCTNSKYGALDTLQKNFQSATQNRDISKFGKMSLAMKGRSYDLKTNEENTNQLDMEYRNILKKIDEQKNIKNQLQVEKQKAFRQLEALQKQQEQLVVDEKRTNLQDIIAQREALAREEQQLQRQIRQYQNKKKMWDKSQVKAKQVADHPYEQGLKAGKLNFQRNMLEERKHNMELQLNAKRRQKQKLQENILKMSAAEDIPVNKGSRATVVQINRSIPAIKSPENSNKNSQLGGNAFDYSRLNNDRPQTESSQTSKLSSYLSPNALDGTEKILKFNLNKEGKSQQDKLIQSIMAQQYDDLLILSKLPKGSELYNMKMKQYTELSKKRMEVQEKAQKQRIQKMKRQFQFQKAIVQKQKQNATWVNENRKAFMTKQLQILNAHNQGLVPSQNSINLGSEKISLPSGAQVPKNSKPSVIPNVPELSSQKYVPAESEGRNNKKKKDPFGYRISVLALRNYSFKKAIKIKLIIYEEYYHEKQMGLKYEYATIYHEESSGQYEPYNPHFKNKLDETGAIAYNESFYVPENLQELYNKNQKQIYLMIIAAEKDEKKVTNQPRPYCWYCFKVTHFGLIKQGRFTVNMYGDNIIYPYPADMNKMKRKMQQEIIFQVQQVLLEQHMMQNLKKKNPSNQSVPAQKPPSSHSNKPVEKPGSQPSVKQNSTKKSHPSVQNPSNNSIPSNQEPDSDKMSMNYPLKMKKVDQKGAVTVDQQYFYSNQKQTEFSHVQLKKPLNFDVSVAGLRTLPSYIGPVKLEMSFVDADSAHVLPREQFIAEIGTDLYNPLVDYTRKIRNQARIPPSTIIFIRMIAISAVDYQIYSLGFSLIYLFLDRQGSPILNNKVTDYFMTSGYYQLPIFWGNIEPRFIGIQQLLTQYAPIPCSSILIGIRQNASKISNPMPLYSEKVYNTILFQVDEEEAKLFSEQYKREPLDTNTLISGYLQYKGIKKNYSGEEINKYLFKTLIFSPENTKDRLQLKWMAQYQQYFGSCLVIDKLFVPESDIQYYYFMTICTSPPASYYKQKSFDLSFCRKVNLDLSTVTQFIYDDNEHFVNPAYFKNTAYIIEVNRIQIFESENTQADNNIEGFAYIVIPLFELQEKIRSVNAMEATLPLFEGDFDTNNIERLEKNLPAYMEKNANSKKSKAEISFRLLNGYFMNQYRKIQPTIGSKIRMYKDITPEGMSFENALEDISSILSSNYNVQID